MLHDNESVFVLRFLTEKKIHVSGDREVRLVFLWERFLFKNVMAKKWLNLRTCLEHTILRKKKRTFSSIHFGIMERRFASNIVQNQCWGTPNSYFIVGLRGGWSGGGLMTCVLTSASQMNKITNMYFLLTSFSQSVKILKRHNTDQKTGFDYFYLFGNDTSQFNLQNSGTNALMSNF